ncbi:TIGR04283 family arsenosugar biosynthesis glycosyltransferase [Shimia sp. R11_0]|uniref:TIGR04283 family arsenosugar biosynthesis glycosyltransferase n=1 Tax=Shimia sp. R11_0 TaxID=2821096 RepID=UPI001ADC94EE|nr:TIGR04283 family arsenosugar biosynthesis glycosyltransferase [Shimia sp. R11_0]MBO9479434.1 TIGR04283 family arsenosugar biosynthesis glycosyltransferase [Shimia sp. R11_0]
MRAPLSVIIATLNAEAELPACLSALYEAVPAGLLRELIVVDGGSSDQTCLIADEAGATILRAAPSRGGQLKMGAEAAKGDWFLFLHADTILEDGWTEVIQKSLLRPDTAAYFALAFRNSGFAGNCVAKWANFRSVAFGLPYGDQGLLISRSLYNEVGGYQDIPLMEDVAISLKLGRKRLSGIPCHANTSAEKYQSQGWLRRGRRNLWMLTRYLLGVTPERLAKEYRRGS